MVADSPELIAGRYRLMDRIGSGGMGHVWLAWDERLNRAVAVKQLHPPVALDESDAALARERAMREARNTARLHHPNAVPVFDVVDDRGRPCLVMQYLPSQSLQAVLRDRGPLPVREVARIGSELASALAAAHRADLVHRDVKPGNVLLAEDGTARITDFGISHAMGDASLTSTGMVTGTPAYLAPEVARGAASTPASDVFSLGATLYAALEGSPPFGAGDNAMALLHRVASGAIDPPSEGPLAPVLLGMLAASPEERPSMQEVSSTLAAVAAGRAPQGDRPAATRVLPAAAAGTAAAGTAAAGTAAAAGGAGRGAAGAATGGAPAAAAGAASGTQPATGPRTAPLSSAPRGTGDPVPPTAPGDDSRAGLTRRRGLLALLALVLVAGAGLLAVSLLGDGPSSGGATPPPVVAGSSRPTQTTPPTSSGAPTSTAQAPSSSAPTPKPTKASPSASQQTTTAGPASGSDLTGAIRDYYGLLPGNTDAGWARLTDRYRSTTARDRATYDRFWASVDAVSVGQAKATGPGSVVATVRYDFSDGRRFEERTAYTLVQQDGILKIDTSSVQSSRQL